MQLLYHTFFFFLSCISLVDYALDYALDYAHTRVLIRLFIPFSPLPSTIKIKLKFSILITDKKNMYIKYIYQMRNNESYCTFARHVPLICMYKWVI